MSRFRLWVQQIWVENKQEHLDLGLSPYTQAEYFQKFKYWLKREYRHQQGQ